MSVVRFFYLKVDKNVSMAHVSRTSKQLLLISFRFFFNFLSQVVLSLRLPPTPPPPVKPYIPNKY